jgi:hypothetical protein
MMIDPESLVKEKLLDHDHLIKGLLTWGWRGKADCWGKLEEELEAKDEHDDSESPYQDSCRKKVNQLDNMQTD